MSKRRIIKSSVPSDYSGLTILEYLTIRFKYLNETQWQEMITEGRVLLGGAQAQSFHVIRQGEIVEFYPDDVNEPEVDRSFEIIHEENDFLVINKPANLPVHPGGIYFQNTLWFLLRERYPQASFLNRLDRETSGIVLMASSTRGRKNMDAQKALTVQEKYYLVMVHGRTSEEFDADGWISHDGQSTVRKKRIFTPSMPERTRAQSCQTSFIRLAENQKYSLLLARLYTGRTHQIRASLCSLGFPVVGDKIYGKDENLFLRMAEGMLNESDRETLVLDHQALHAVHLRIGFSEAADLHPGKDMRFTAALPMDFRQLIRQELSVDLKDSQEILSCIETHIGI